MIIIILIAIIISKFYTSWKENEYRDVIIKRSNLISPTETIFVSVPNYRDSETPKTIYNLFAKAHCPYRIYVGLCNQTKNIPGEREVVDQVIKIASSSINSDMKFTSNFTSFFQSNIRVEYVPHNLARGPVIARAAIEKRLYAGEKYFMMIDSHMRFVKDWDKKALENLHNCPSERPILTMYPNSYEKKTHNVELFDNEPPSCLFIDQFDDRGFPIIRGRSFVSVPARPTKQLFWTPCFSFTFAVAHKEVPYDPNMRNLFSGEQISMSVRLWSCGWDFFAPNTMICKHLYDRSYRPTFWELEKSSDDAECRVQCLLGIRPLNSVHEKITKDFNIYGLGQRRTIEQYQKFANIDFQNKKFGKRAHAGISEDAPNDEILAKYGSFSDLRHLRKEK